MPSSPPKPGSVNKVTIQRGLEGQDDNLDLLQSYFKELKAVTVEPSPPELDLLTFAICTHYFGVITIQDVDDKDAEGEPEEDSLDAGYVASPPPLLISRATSVASACSAVHSDPNDSTSEPGRAHIPPPSPEEEKVLKWREAFLAQLQEEGDNEEISLESHLSKGKMRERQYIPTVNPPAQIPNTSNNFDDYVNWPDDIQSDEHAQDDQLYHETEAYSRLDGAELTPVLGREILIPEQFYSPVGTSEICPDPTLKAFVHDEAMKYQGMLRGQRIKAYQDASAFKSLFIDPGPKPKPIGIIYLASSQNVDDPMHRGQLNIGIYVAPMYIEEAGVVQAVKKVVNEAFHDPNCHRLQAIIVDHTTKINTLELYTASGFSREGVGRQGFFSPITHEWKDVFYFTILATDWVLDNPRLHPKTPWEDLLLCHQREREELLRMEEKTLKRSTSTETIRDKTPIAPSIASTSRSEISSVANSSTSANPSTRKVNKKRKRVKIGSDPVENTSRSRAPSISTSSSIGRFETMSTISSEWELPASQTFAIPTSDGASPPASSSSTGHWVMLDVVNSD